MIYVLQMEMDDSALCRPGSQTNAIYIVRKGIGFFLEFMSVVH